MDNLEFGINFFGSKTNKKSFNKILDILQKNINNFKIYLVIAGTDTSQIQGISAAGINKNSRRKTALADAEFLLLGASKDHKYKLPLLNAGVTPALISYVCSKLISASPIVVPLGIKVKPYFSHLALEDELYIEKAHNLLKKAVKIDNKNSYAWFQLAIAEARLGNFGKADLFSAERFFILGNVELAAFHAKRAKKNLKNFGALLMRAEDIILDSKNKKKWKQRCPV